MVFEETNIALFQHGFVTALQARKLLSVCCLLVYKIRN